MFIIRRSYSQRKLPKVVLADGDRSVLKWKHKLHFKTFAFRRQTPVQEMFCFCVTCFPLEVNLCCCKRSSGGVSIIATLTHRNTHLATSYCHTLSNSVISYTFRPVVLISSSIQTIRLIIHLMFLK